MIDDLVKRLRTPVGVQDLPFIQEEAADRIEELEAKLAKAMRLISEKPILATYEDDVQWQKYVIEELSSVSCANTTGGKDE